MTGFHVGPKILILSLAFAVVAPFRREADQAGLMPCHCESEHSSSSAAEASHAPTRVMCRQNLDLARLAVADAAYIAEPCGQ